MDQAEAQQVRVHRSSRPGIPSFLQPPPPLPPLLLSHLLHQCPPCSKLASTRQALPVSILTALPKRMSATLVPDRRYASKAECPTGLRRSGGTLQRGPGGDQPPDQSIAGADGRQLHTSDQLSAGVLPPETRGSIDRSRGAGWLRQADGKATTQRTTHHNCCICSTTRPLHNTFHAQRTHYMTRPVQQAMCIGCVAQCMCCTRESINSWLHCA